MGYGIDPWFLRVAGAGPRTFRSAPGVRRKSIGMPDGTGAVEGFMLPSGARGCKSPGTGGLSMMHCRIAMEIRPGTHREREALMNLRQRTLEVLDPSHSGDLLSRMVNYGMAGLIGANVAAMIAESMPGIASPFFGIFEAVSVAAFTVEYLLRMWSSGSRGEGRGSAGSSLRFMVSPLGIVDLLAILPWYLPFIGIDLRVLRVLRLLRIARLGRYSIALRAMVQVVVRVRRELAVACTLGLVMLLIASTVMYFAEHEAQPEAFSSIPAASWWAVATLTTVGYGDVYPVTTWGRVAGGIVAALGIGLFALPTAILGTAFLDVLRGRERVCPHCGRTSGEADPDAG